MESGFVPVVPVVPVLEKPPTKEKKRVGESRTSSRGCSAIGTTGTNSPPGGQNRDSAGVFDCAG